MYWKPSRHLERIYATIHLRFVHHLDIYILDCRLSLSKILLHPFSRRCWWKIDFMVGILQKTGEFPVPIIETVRNTTSCSIVTYQLVKARIYLVKAQKMSAGGVNRGRSLLLFLLFLVVVVSIKLYT